MARALLLIHTATLHRRRGSRDTAQVLEEGGRVVEQGDLGNGMLSQRLAVFLKRVAGTASLAETALVVQLCRRHRRPQSNAYRGELQFVFVSLDDPREIHRLVLGLVLPQPIGHFLVDRRAVAVAGAVLMHVFVVDSALEPPSATLSPTVRHTEDSATRIARVLPRGADLSQNEVLRDEEAYRERRGREAAPRGASATAQSPPSSDSPYSSPPPIGRTGAAVPGASK